MKGIDGYDPIPVYFFPVPLLLLCLRDSAGMRRVSPHRLSPAPAVARRAAGPANRVSWPNLRGRDSPAFQILAIETEDGGDGLASGGHIHKSKAPGSTTMPVLHYVRRFNLAKRFKNLAQITARHIPGQIPYTDIHAVPLSLASNTGLWRACQTERTDSRDGS